MPAFIFDLDQTLLDTAALKTWRDQRLWKQVLANLSQSSPFQADDQVQPHELPGMLKAQGHQIGIVTNSISSYAKSLLAMYDIAYDTLVAYHDTKLHKPHPEPLILAKERLGLANETCFYIGDDVDDFAASSRAGMISIGAGWGIKDFVRVGSAAPDILIDLPSLLLESRRLRLGYAAERILGGKNYSQHSGSVLRIGAPGIDWALGRYFQTADSRSTSSEFSKALLELKASDMKSERFSESLVAGIGSLGWKPDFIIPVPSKPSQTRNRFAAILKHAKKNLAAEVKVQIDGLTCTREIEGYKRMGAQERAQAMTGVFESQYTWTKSHKILVIDDVSTTATTALEAIRALKHDGAGEVKVLCFGIDQRVIDPKKCGVCGRLMRIRKNNKDGSTFYGCSGYPNNCTNTEPL